MSQPPPALQWELPQFECRKAIGAKSIAVTRSEAKKEALLGVGADQVIIAGGEDVQEAILELTEGFGAEVIYDAVAGPGLEELVWRQKDSAT